LHHQGKILDIEKLKSQVKGEVDRHSIEICELSRKIHENPELGFQEYKAAEWITAFLEKKGFTIERGICELPTAFRASYGRSHPIIAFLAEYDALPNLGHGCGHNLIAAASVGAALSSKPAIDSCGGTVLVIGTPAEELYSGKMVMAERGAFADLDATMMVHPGSHDAAVTEALACQGLDVEFWGKSSHAAGRPESGVNALEAMIQSFNAINSLRQHIRSTARIHGIITDGGQAANVVPDHSAGKFLVRAADEKYLAELRQKVLNCFTGAATATGARLEYKWEAHYYAPMLNNLTLGELFVVNMRQLGRKIQLEDPDKSFGSTDFGNVSQIVPGMHASVSVAHRNVPIHSPEFVKAAISKTGLESMLDAAKAMALTLADLVSDQKKMDQVKKEFFKHK
jgi:amidohydrolase